jgi:hypothetical protein
MKAVWIVNFFNYSASSHEAQTQNNQNRKSSIQF